MVAGPDQGSGIVEEPIFESEAEKQSILKSLDDDECVFMPAALIRGIRIDQLTVGQGERIKVGVGEVQHQQRVMIESPHGRFPVNLNLRWEQSDETFDYVRRGKFFESIICRNKYSALGFGILCMALTFFVPQIGIPLGAYLGYELLMSRVNTEIQQVTKNSLPQVTEAIERTTSAASSVIEKATNLVQEFRGIDQDESLCWQKVLKNAQRHKFGLLATMHSAYKAESALDFASEGLKAFSFLGLEESVVTAAVQRSGLLVRNEQFDLSEMTTPAVSFLEGSLHSAVSAVQAATAATTKTSFEVKRLCGLTGLGVTLAGINLKGFNPLDSISKASAAANSLEDWFGKTEEYLNALGVIHTGKWAYMKELANRLDATREDFEYFNKLLAVTPAIICRSSVWKRWLKFRKEIHAIDDVCRRNTCPDLRRSTIFTNVTACLTKVLQWDGLIQQVRETNGLRPTPVGICLWGASGIGKSTVWAEIQKRIRTKLYAKFLEDPEKYCAFSDANEWGCWNQQTRDDYDQGCDGQEFHYCDDGFSAKDNEDHKAWLTFISNQAIGTVQADLASKGRPYRARAVCVSCNQIPDKSATIANVYALHNRFPFTAVVSIKDESINPSMFDRYDPDFKHLEFRVAPMGTWVELMNGRTSFDRVSNYDTSGAVDKMTLEELVQEIVHAIIRKEEAYDSMAGLVERTNTFVESEVRQHQYDPENRQPIQSWSAESQAWPEVRLARTAYAVDPISHVHDQRIIPLFNCLQYRGAKLLDYVQELDDDANMRLFFAIQQIGRCEVIPGKEDELRRILAAFAAHPVRFYLDQTDATYLWSPRWGAGSVIIHVPSYDGIMTNRQFNAPENQEQSQVSANLSSLFRPQGNHLPRASLVREDPALIAEMDESFASRFDDPSGRASMQWWWCPGVERFDVATGSDASMNRIIRASQGIIILGMTGAAWPLVHFLGNFGHPTEVYPIRWLATRRYVSELMDPENTPLNRFWAGLLVPVMAVSDAMRYVHNFCVWSANRAVDAVNWLFDFVGVPLSSLVDGMMRYIAEIGISAFSALLIPFVGAALYTLLSWIGRQIKSSPEQVEESDVKQKRLPSKPVKMARRAAQGVEESEVKQRRLPSKQIKMARRINEYKWVDLTAPPEPGKVNFYTQKDLDCPFCDEKQLTAQGENMFLDAPSGAEYRMKRNKHPKAGFDDSFVVLPTEHGERNPLRDRDLFIDEMEMMKAFATEMTEDCRFVFERNCGYLSGGSVPHEHIQFHPKADLIQKTGITSDLKVVKALREKVFVGDSERVAITAYIEVYGPDWGEIFDRLSPLVEKLNLKSWLVQGECVDDVWSMIFVMLSAQDGNMEKPFVKRTHGLVLQELEVLRGVLDAVPETTVDEAVTGLIEEQADDNGAISLLNKVVSENMGVICRGVARDGLDYSNFDVTLGPSCSAVLWNKRALFPAHMGSVGDLLKSYKTGRVGTEGWRNNLTTDTYQTVKIVALDEERDVALGILITREEAEEHLLKQFGAKVSLSYAAKKIQPYARGIAAHFMSDKEAVDATHNAVCLQYLPRKAMFYGARCHQVRRQRITFTSGKEGIRTWYEVAGLSEEMSVSDTGDCGGPLILYNSKFPRKFLGFHVAGGYRVMNSAIVTLELIADLERALPEAVRVEQIATSVLSTQSVFNPPGEAGYGYQQFDTWPKVEWADANDDPFRPLIAKGPGVDSPKGPCTRDMGVFVGANESANRMAGLKDWKLAPTADAFPLVMEPAPLDPLDERIEVELPRNMAGNPSLTLGPNSVMAEDLPAPEKETFESVVECLFHKRREQFRHDLIGSPGLDEDQIIHEGMNGHPANRHVTGMEINASAGVPWTATGQRKKKSDMIEVDDLGQRAFIEEKGLPLQKLLRKRLRLACQGKRTTSFYSSKLKNICIKSEKAKIGKTRVFYCSSVDDVILINGLFGRYKDRFIQKRLDCQHAIGINVHSPEWRQLYDHMSVFPCVTDADYKNFDKHLLSCFLRAAYMIVIETINEVCPDEYKMARYVMAECDVNSIILDERSAYMTEHSNKSGSAMTTLINCEVNLLMNMYCFVKATGLPPDQFFTYCRFVSFGDDMLLSIDPEIAESFNFNSLKLYLSEMGQEVTPGLKYDGDVPDYVDISQVTFLKRRFKMLQSLLVAPLETTSIEGCFGWTDVDWRNVDVVVGMLEQQMHEAFLHGREYYKYFTDQLLKVTREYSFPGRLRKVFVPILTRAYEGQQNLYYMLYGVRTEQSDSEFGRYVHSQGITVFEALSDLGIVDSEVSMGALRDRVSKLEVKVDAIDIDSIYGQIQQLGKLVDVASTNASTALIEARSNTTKIEDLEKRLKVVENIEISIDQKFADVHASINTLSAQLYGRIAQLESSLKMINDKLMGYINKHTDRLDGLDKELEAIRSTLATHKASIDQALKSTQYNWDHFKAFEDSWNAKDRTYMHQSPNYSGTNVFYRIFYDQSRQTRTNIEDGDIVQFMWWRNGPPSGKNEDESSQTDSSNSRHGCGSTPVAL